jgi:thioredoxin 1
MKNYQTTFSLLLILLLNSCVNGQTKNTNLTAADFDAKIKATPSAVIVDVRTPEEFSEGHLINAKNIDWNGDKFDAEISQIDKSKPVFVYCRSGGRSSSAAHKMREDGFKEVYELSGGITDWRNANMPEIK